MKRADVLRAVHLVAAVDDRSPQAAERLIAAVDPRYIEAARDLLVMAVRYGIEGDVDMVSSCAQSIEWLIARPSFDVIVGGAKARRRPLQPPALHVVPGGAS